jgi:hypothetical protein
VQENDLLGFGSKDWRPIRAGIASCGANRTVRGRGRPGSRTEQHRQRYAADADMALMQKVPPRDAVKVFEVGIHVPSYTALI